MVSLESNLVTINSLSSGIFELNFRWCNFQCNFRNFHDDVIKWRHFPRNWPFVQGIHRSLVNSPHKGQWCRALMFSLICVWINGWVTNGEAGDLRCHHAHYDVLVMFNWWCLDIDSNKPSPEPMCDPFWCQHMVSPGLNKLTKMGPCCIWFLHDIIIPMITFTCFSFSLWIATGCIAKPCSTETRIFQDNFVNTLCHQNIISHDIK